MSFTGRTGTTAKSGMREGGLVIKPSLPTRTDRDSRFGGERGGPGINNDPPTRTDRDIGTAELEVHEV